MYLLFHLLTTIAKLIQPGGARSVLAENLLLKQQLIIHSRSRQRAPNLTTQDRTLLGFLSLFLNPRRLIRSAIIIKPSTLLHFHNAIKKRKYRLLYSPRGGRKPGSKGPSQEVINAIAGMKRLNPRYGCPRIAQQINLAFGLDLVSCHASYDAFRAPHLCQGKARFAGNGARPCQELQRSFGANAGLPPGKTISGHPRCCARLN